MRQLILAILFMQLGMCACGKSSDRPAELAGDVAMKEIAYRGGLVRFSIPSDWKEEYDQDGGGLFHGASSGTLHLNVLTFAATDARAVDIEANARDMAAKHNGNVIVLREGEVMARYDRQETENGEAITFRTWAIHDRVDESNVRIVVFTYSLPSARFVDEKHKKQIDMIDREIRSARLANVVGTLQ
jgi:hypothetical protein